MRYFLKKVAAALLVSTVSAPAFAVTETSGTSFDFGEVLIGETVTQSYSYSTTGAAGGFWDLSSDSASDFDAFTISNSTCNEVSGSTSCSFDLSFSPVEEGATSISFYIDYYVFFTEVPTLIGTAFDTFEGVGVAPQDDVTVVPLPSSLVLLLGGLTGVAGVRRFRKG